MTRLKAVLKALSDSYPSALAMTPVRSLEFSSLSAASSIRQRARYSMGVSPTVFLNFWAKLDRDMPADSASSCKVQPCAGSSCMALIAAPIWLFGIA